MKGGIQLTYLWHDVDVVELRIVVENKEFRGTVDAYVGHSELAVMLSSLQGFPTDRLDKRTVSFGMFGPGFGGGAARFDFYCRDSAGHSAFSASLEADYQNERTQTATILVNFDPAALDEFLSELLILAGELQGSAALKSY